jgi:hypothetical protein
MKAGVCVSTVSTVSCYEGDLSDRTRTDQIGATIVVDITGWSRRCPDPESTVADAADGADGALQVVCILMILFPARPSRLNVMSMPRTRRNVCAQRSRPASARGFLGQPPVLSLEMPSLLRPAERVCNFWY